MYSDIKSCVSFNGERSTFFSCNCGVRQGENLSPILFSLYLNDLEKYLEEKGSRGIEFSNIGNGVEVFFKIFILLYADDTALLSDDPTDFQHCLDSFMLYCQQWKLNVNVDKTKIMIFGAKRRNKFQFNLNNRKVDIVTDYKYLGIIFSTSGTFVKAKKHLAEQARKA